MHFVRPRQVIQNLEPADQVEPCWRVLSVLEGFILNARSHRLESLATRFDTIHFGESEFERFLQKKPVPTTDVQQPVIFLE